MSSPLPVALRMSVKDAARDSETGLVQCAMCRQFYPDESIQIDHITPEWKGGGHDPLNLQPLCAPKVGGGCHRLKSRAEAKERAALAKEAANNPAGGRPGWWVAAALSGAGSAIAARCAWLSAQGESIGPFLHTVHDYLGYGAAAGWALSGLAVLGHAGAWLMPMFEDFLSDEVVESNAAVTPAGRLKDALDDVMGQDIKVTDRANDMLRVQYSKSFRDTEENDRYKVLARINAKMGGRWKITWHTEHDFFDTRPRPALPSMVRHPGLDPARPWQIIPIADGIAIDLRVTSHTLIIGKTNGGKTALIRSIILAALDSAARGQAESILVDPKQVELIGFEGWPGVRKVVTDLQEMWDAPLALEKEMNERYRLFRDPATRTPLSSHKPILFVLDEYEEYVKRMERHWQSIDPATSKPRKQQGEKVPPPVAAMASILALARKCGIHVIIGTQRPDAAWFGGAARDNLQCRIGVGPLSVGALRMLFERTDVGRDLPMSAKGRFTIQTLDGDFEEGQSYWVADPADADGKNSEEDWEHLRQIRATLDLAA